MRGRKKKSLEELEKNLAEFIENSGRSKQDILSDYNKFRALKKRINNPRSRHDDIDVQQKEQLNAAYLMGCSIINTQSKINKARLTAAAVNATTSNVANTPVNNSAFITPSVAASDVGGEESASDQMAMATSAVTAEASATCLNQWSLQPSSENPPPEAHHEDMAEEYDVSAVYILKMMRNKPAETAMSNAGGIESTSCPLAMEMVEDATLKNTLGDDTVEGPRMISVGSITTIDGAFSVTAGDSSRAAGGDVSIASGSSSTSSGGSLALASGDGNTSEGAVTIEGGDGSTATGGSITISSGISTATSSGSVAVSMSSATKCEGSPFEILAKHDAASVQCSSMITLRPPMTANPTTATTTTAATDGIGNTASTLMTPHSHDLYSPLVAIIYRHSFGSGRTREITVRIQCASDPHPFSNFCSISAKEKKEIKCLMESIIPRACDDLPDILKQPMNNHPMRQILSKSAPNLYYGSNCKVGGSVDGRQTVHRMAYATGSGSRSVCLEPDKFQVKNFVDEHLSLIRNITSIYTRYCKQKSIHIHQPSKLMQYPSRHID